MATIRGLLAMLGLALILGMTGSPAAAETVTIGVELRVPATLTITPCTIHVVIGGTISGNLNDCVIGGAGPRTFGPVGTDMPAPFGGTITILADGSYTYTAGQNSGATDFPFTAQDNSVTGTISGNVTVIVVDRIQASFPIFHLAPGGSISGNLNDYVSGGFGTYRFGPTGTNIPTPGGGTITINVDGTFTYTAPPYETDDSFEYTVLDDSVTEPVAAMITAIVRGATAPTETPPATTTPTEPAAPTPAQAGTPVTGGAPIVTALPNTGTGSTDGISTPLIWGLAMVIAAGCMVFGTRRWRHGTGR